MRHLLAISLFALALTAPVSLAAKDNEQNQMRSDMRNGKVMKLRDIEAKILPSMQGMQYLGPEYDPVALAYRLKFIREGRVTFVDVDARTGEIIRQSR
jgi:nucleoside-specific outer membrane channel protein Tsx